MGILVPKDFMSKQMQPFFYVPHHENTHCHQQENGYANAQRLSHVGSSIRCLFVTNAQWLSRVSSLIHCLLGRIKIVIYDESFHSATYQYVMYALFDIRLHMMG